jgi:hypothetical protein
MFTASYHVGAGARIGRLQKREGDHVVDVELIAELEQTDQLLLTVIVRRLPALSVVGGA